MTGVERIPELVALGRKNLSKYTFSNAGISATGEKLGLPEEAPPAIRRPEGFDRILVSAAAEEIPQELVRQLNIGGRMVIPIQNSIVNVDRVAEKRINTEEYFGFSFVPLVHGGE